MRYEELLEAVSSTGLLLRGGFHPECADAVPQARAGCDTRTVVLVGSAGPAGWRAIAAGRTPGPDPLERWTRAQMEPIAARANARAVYPEDQPFLPFLRWAQRADAVHPSPLGLLIHPLYGLWHSYRAALLLAARIDVPPRGTQSSPCETCVGRPCLQACPVDAFRDNAFNSDACHSYLGTQAGVACMDDGCKARNACPVANKLRYAPEQIRFHMAAFHRTPVGTG
jgi:hypothetical protein